MPELAHCRCDLFDVPCSSTATQEDLLCDTCRWFKRNRSDTPRASHGVTTRHDGKDFSVNAHFNFNGLRQSLGDFQLRFTANPTDPVIRMYKALYP